MYPVEAPRFSLVSPDVLLQVFDPKRNYGSQVIRTPESPVTVTVHLNGNINNPYDLHIDVWGDRYIGGRIFASRMGIDESGHVTGLDGNIHTWYRGPDDTTYHVPYEQSFDEPGIMLRGEVSKSLHAGQQLVLQPNEVLALNLDAHGFPVLGDIRATLGMYLTQTMPDGSAATSLQLIRRPIVPAAIQ